MSQSQDRVIYILNGPNLNLLGSREPEIYGTTTLDDIEKAARDHAEKSGFAIAFHQSNHEGTLVDWIQEAGGKAVGLMINAGAFTHTSVALRDALSPLTIPVVEIHLSNIFAREEFRHMSHISPVATGIISGFGAHSYILGLDAVISAVS